ncbi:MAG: carbohydrate ABC transporter permease [Pseudanabaenaceae cyanobacterium bins.68]|nr:carbohydrate ABC transporter permease [Pseudanabaenaceae cyanobacterium bins.68]
MEWFKLSPRTFWHYILSSAIAIVMVFPLLWMLSTAFKSSNENLFSFPPQLFPSQPTWQNFGRVWQSHPFYLYVWNSTLVAAIAVVLNLLFCALAAFPLARIAFKGRKLIFWLVIATTIIPFQITLVPLYILAVKLNLRNTYAGLILPYGASAFGIFLLRQAFLAIPKELEEAATLDGCHPLGIWWHVMIPGVRPALTTLAIFTFVGMWGDFLWPLIMVDRPSLFTLPLGVVSLTSAFSEDWRLICAGAIVSILPILILFIFAQKYIIPTDFTAGVKG